jgi:hypothetical protein
MQGYQFYIEKMHTALVVITTWRQVAIIYSICQNFKFMLSLDIGDHHA